MNTEVLHWVAAMWKYFIASSLLGSGILLYRYLHVREDNIEESECLQKQTQEAVYCHMTGSLYQVEDKDQENALGIDGA